MTKLPLMATLPTNLFADLTAKNVLFSLVNILFVRMVR